MRLILLLGLLALGSSCRLSQTYPFFGAVAGGAAGGTAGPVAAGGGAAVGWSMGKTAQLYSENRELVETVEAISRGEVGDIAGKIVKEQIEKNTSRFDEALNLLYYCLWGVVLWNLIPLVYAHVAHRKAKKNGEAIKS